MRMNKDFREFREKFVKNTRREQKSPEFGKCHFAFYSKEHKIKLHHKACYAMMLSPKNDGIEYSRMLETTIIYLEQTTERLEYVHWLANKSQWSRVFLTKDAADIMSNGAVLSLNYPACFVIQAAINLRYLMEFPSIVRNWTALSKHISGRAAIVLAHLLTLTQGSKTNFTTSVLHSNNHTWFQSRHVGRPEFRRVVMGEIARPRWKHCRTRDKWNYAPLNDCWHDAPWRGMFRLQTADDLSQYIKRLSVTYTLKTVWGSEQLLHGVSAEKLPALVRFLMKKEKTNEKSVDSGELGSVRDDVPY